MKLKMYNEFILTNEAFGMNKEKVEELEKALRKIKIDVESNLKGIVSILHKDKAVLKIDTSHKGFINQTKNDIVKAKYKADEQSVLVADISKYIKSLKLVKEQAIADVADISFDGKNVTYIKNDFEITGFMSRYEFIPDSLDAETEEYWDRNWEDISAEIVDAYNDELGKKFKGGRIEEKFGPVFKKSKDLKVIIQNAKFEVGDIIICKGHKGSIEEPYEIKDIKEDDKKAVYVVKAVDEDSKSRGNSLIEIEDTDKNWVLFKNEKQRKSKVDEGLGDFFKFKDEDENKDDLHTRREVKVHFEDGDYFSTEINGTKQSITDYYVGKTFNIGFGPDDNMKKCTKIEFKNEPKPMRANRVHLRP